MATLNDIATINIGLATGSAERANYGYGMIIGPHMAWPELVRKYSGTDAAEDDGIAGPILTALSDYFAQTPRPAYCYVGRRPVGTANIVINPINNFGYTITVTGTSSEVYTFTSDATATASEIATGLALAITSDTNETLTATVVGNELQLAWISQNNLQGVKLGSNLSWGTVTALNGAVVSADVTAIKNENNDWYGFAITDRTKALQLAFAEWGESQKKLFFFSSADADILNASLTTDVVSMAKASQYYRTVGIYHSKADTEFAEMAWMANGLTFTPGKADWSWKRLASITAETSKTLSETQAATVHAKGGNTVEFYSSTLSLTAPGKVVAGEWIDIIRDRDWLENTMQTNWVTMRVQRPKIPYTNPGIQLCVTNMRKSLAEAVSAGVIAPDEVDSDGVTVPGFVIGYPNSQDVPVNIKGTRVLYTTFSARLAGSVKNLVVNGTLGYEII